MKLSTKALTSLLLATTVGVMPGVTHLPKKGGVSRYERILQKHDRKAELRASVVGLPAEYYRNLEKKHSLGDIVRMHGFNDERAFRLALLGKIKHELRQRGWTHRRIERHVEMRIGRVA